MANSRPFKKQKIDQADWNRLNTDVVQLIADRHLTAKDTLSLALSCQQLWHPLQTVLDKKRQQKFLQAVLDDDRMMVKKLLGRYPQLLHAVPPKNMVLESRCTWQKFIAEDALSMAVKRKQIEMIQLLLSYNDKPEQTAALSAWSFYEMKINANEEEEIVIPPAYVDIIQSMMTVFTQETFTENKCCATTEDALSQFYEMLLPEHAVRFDGYFDIELLLYAAYKMYDDHFDDFLNWEQRNAFCIRVIGFIQSLLSPETAKIFCAGLYYVVEENRKISDRATSLKLLGGESFYRLSRESRAGLGFYFIADWVGFWSPTVRRGAAYDALRWGAGVLEKLCRAKATNFRNFMLRPQQQQHSLVLANERSRCVIL
jgi:hypothetical protein